MTWEQPSRLMSSSRQTFKFRLWRAAVRIFCHVLCLVQSMITCFPDLGMGPFSRLIQLISWTCLLPKYTIYIYIYIYRERERERERERCEPIYIYIYILIYRQTASLYHNSSMWLDSRDASNLSWFYVSQTSVVIISVSEGIFCA